MVTEKGLFMWKKDNEIYSGHSIVLDGMRIFNPTPEMLEKAGYVQGEPTIPETIIPEPVEPTKRYSTLKIIRALGDDWPSYKMQLETAGVLDQFFAASYISSDDPVFIAVSQNIPAELLVRLDTECRWTPD
jgi:hypothetical protein